MPWNRQHKIEAYVKAIETWRDEVVAHSKMNVDLDVATRTSTRLSSQPQMGSHTKSVSSAERRRRKQGCQPRHVHQRRLTVRTLLFSRRHLGPLATSFRRVNRSSPCRPETESPWTLPSSSKRWSHTEDNPSAQAAP